MWLSTYRQIVSTTYEYELHPPIYYINKKSCRPLWSLWCEIQSECARLAFHTSFKWEYFTKRSVSCQANVSTRLLSCNFVSILAVVVSTVYKSVSHSWLAGVFLSICKYMQFLLWTLGALWKWKSGCLGLFLCKGLIAGNYFVNLFGHTVYPSGFYFVHKKLKVPCNQQLATNTIKTVKKGQNVWKYSSGTLQYSVFP